LARVADSRIASPSGIPSSTRRRGFMRDSWGGISASQVLPDGCEPGGGYGTMGGPWVHVRRGAGESIRMAAARPPRPEGHRSAKMKFRPAAAGLTVILAIVGMGCGGG